MAEIALRENVTDNYVGNLIHLAWLPPKTVESILDGHPPGYRQRTKLDAQPRHRSHLGECSY